MKKEVAYVDGVTFIRVPKNVAKELFCHKDFFRKLYWCSWDSHGMIQLSLFLEYDKMDLEELSAYIDSLENRHIYYNNSKPKWWFRIDGEGYDNYSAISADYYNSNECYSTIVKRYSKRSDKA